MFSWSLPAEDPLLSLQTPSFSLFIYSLNTLIQSNASACVFIYLFGPIKEVKEKTKIIWNSKKYRGILTSRSFIECLSIYICMCVYRWAKSRVTLMDGPCHNIIHPLKRNFFHFFHLFVPSNSSYHRLDSIFDFFQFAEGNFKWLNYSHSSV